MVIEMMFRVNDIRNQIQSNAQITISMLNQFLSITLISGHTGSWKNSGNPESA